MGNVIMPTLAAFCFFALGRSPATRGGGRTGRRTPTHEKKTWAGFLCLNGLGRSARASRNSRPQPHGQPGLGLDHVFGEWVNWTVQRPLLPVYAVLQTLCRPVMLLRGHRPPHHYAGGALMRIFQRRTARACVNPACCGWRNGSRAEGLAAIS